MIYTRCVLRVFSYFYVNLTNKLMESTVGTHGRKPNPRPISYIIAFAVMIPLSFAIGYFFALRETTPALPESKCRTTTVDSANMFFNAYYKNAKPIGDIIKGVLIERDQFLGMKELFDDPNINGVRLYFGLNEKQFVKILVGFKSAEKDTLNKVLLTNTRNIELCPTICDVQSPITLIKEE